jgi:hypothetical protein
MKLTTSLFDEYFIHNYLRMFTILVSIDDPSVPEKRTILLNRLLSVMNFKKMKCWSKFRKRSIFLLDKYSYEEHFTKCFFVPSLLTVFEDSNLVNIWKIKISGWIIFLISIISLRKMIFEIQYHVIETNFVYLSINFSVYLET